MAYLAQWNSLKQNFQTGNETIAAQVKKAKADLKKEKKAGGDDQVAIERLEQIVTNGVTVGKKKTGMSQILPIYDKLLDKMEKMIAKGVPASEKKSWNPLVKELTSAKATMQKASASAQKNFGEIIARQQTGYNQISKADKVLGKEAPKILVGKNIPAREILSGITLMQNDIKKRMDKIHEYLRDEMRNW